MSSTTVQRLLVGCLGIVGLAGSAVAVPPTIHVTWDEVPGPTEPDDYLIDATDPDLPDIELKTGSLTWRIWSEDADNPNNIGDIGDITAFSANNFSLTLRKDATTPGGGNVQSIVLNPQGTSNHSNLVDSEITGSVVGHLYVEDLSTGGAGVLTMIVGGSVLGTIDAGRVTSAFTLVGVASGDVTIDDIMDDATVDLGYLAAGRDIFSFLLHPGATLRLGGPVLNTSTIEILSLSPNTLIELGYSPGINNVEGIIKLPDIMVTQKLKLHAGLSATGDISLENGGGDLDGTIEIVGAVAGAIRFHLVRPGGLLDVGRCKHGDDHGGRTRRWDA